MHQSDGGNRFTFFVHDNRYMKRIFLLITLILLAPAAFAHKVALLSTQFVLEHKFRLMQAASEGSGIDLHWVQADREGEEGVRKALAEARLVIIDAPRAEDQAQIEHIAGKLLRETAVPVVTFQTFGGQISPIRLAPEIAERLYGYYVAGQKVNRERLFHYLRIWMQGGDLSEVPPPADLPDGGIYHPGHADSIFPTLPEYLNWWEKQMADPALERPVIAMEIPSTYIADGQTRMLDEVVSALEQAGALPLVFYRSTRISRGSTVQVSGSNESNRRPGATGNRGFGERGSAGAGADNSRENPVDIVQPRGSADFPNPAERRNITIDEPLITYQGKIIPQVILVNTFLGSAPENRKAWHQALGIPAINVLSYRGGTRTDYLKDSAGIGSYFVPFTLTTAEYIGLQDPVVLTTNEGGEFVPLPEQLDLLVGKAINLARLNLRANADKRVALLFWNHPPGEKNQGASNLNVPRSLEYLVEHLRSEGYAFEAVTEQQMIDTVGQMLRPAYRAGDIPELMRTPHWDFLPLARYRAWYATLPESVRNDIEAHWGNPEESVWLAHKDGVNGFVIPRMQLGNLVVMPQPSRGEMAGMEEEKKLFHDTRQPPGHAYLASYLWIREQFSADAIVHFGTHGTQEWTPGKERGLWAYDYPNILVGNLPVIYPYIVDNIGEAIHVKRRGRGVIISHQTPAFSPAGLSDDFVRLNDLIRKYQSLDQGLVRDNNRKLIIEQAVRMNIHQDMQWKVAELERNFDNFLRDIEDYLEDLGTAQQPLGLHTLGRDAEQAHQISNVMQMLGQPLYDLLGIEDARTLLREDYRKIQQSEPYRFVETYVFSDQPLNDINDPGLRAMAERGRTFRMNLHAAPEIDSIVKGLSSRWIDPSYGGDPIRNPDALPTGRNMYGFDPGRVPTRAAYEAGRQAVEQLIASYKLTHDKFPEKLAFSMWSTETMRHLGMLEAQIFYAMGVRPVWDEGGRVTGMEVIPLSELGRPRIDTVISLTGLYRDQFPNVMERFNQAITLLAEQDEPDSENPIRANTRRIRAQLEKLGVTPETAREFALTRIFGNESGDYSTRLTQATLASDKWDEKDGKLENLYLSRMSWAYGPNPAHWSQKLTDGKGNEINAYAEHLRGTSAAVFSRSSNLRGLLDTDHPFEYLGGISMAVRHLDGTSPQLYISNLRDPARARLESAEKFMARELRAVYQHPNWIREMQKEGYSGTLQMLDTINNFWGWQVMDRNITRDDQWEEFHQSYIADRYNFDMRDWFEKSNPAALAQIAERMLEAIRKDYWEASEQTRRELVEVYTDIANRHDIQTDNATFKAYVAELAAGYGLNTPDTPVESQANPQPEPQQTTDIVRGQQMVETPVQPMIEEILWNYAWLLIGIIAAGAVYQSWRTYRERQAFSGLKLS